MAFQNLPVAPNKKCVADQHNPNTPTTFCSFSPAPAQIMDDDMAVATVEEQQKQIENELKKQKLAASCTRKEEVEGWLITAGEGELANSNVQLTICLHVLTF